MRVGLVVTVAIGAVIVAGAASASTPHRKNVDFASAPLGPASAFVGVSRGHTAGPQIVLAARARRVALIHWNGERPLLVAPTRSGGFCKSLTGPYGGTGCFASNARARNTLDPGLTGDTSGPIAFNGTVFDSRAARIEVDYQDGRTSVLPIIWVDAPINAGFFVLKIPRAQRHPGHRPVTISLYSANRERLARTKLADH